MSTITQDVPNFLNGISQQPDKKKISTQVKDAVNTYPDYALGMLKRPGGKFVSNLYNAENITTTLTAGTHNGVTDNSRTAGTFYVANAGGSSSGTGADFKIIVDSEGKPDVYIDNRNSKTGGAGYSVGETITIADSSLGNGGGAAVVLTVATIYTKGVEVKIASGGKGYAVGDALTIADSVMGSGGGAAITVTITKVGTYGKWFSILRDENEKYV